MQQFKPIIDMNIPATTPELQTITPNDSAYPVALTNCTAFKSPPTLSAIGNLSLIQKPAFGTAEPKVVALFCSIKCPGAQYPNRARPGMPGSKDGFVDDLMAKLNQLF
jgi:hypothetical protein